MILEKDSKVLVVHRRLFEDDRLRYFFGVVEAYEQGVIKIKGYTWLRDPHTTAFFQKEEERTKILSASSGTHIIYELPDQLDINNVRSFSKEDGRFFFTDDKEFQIDITEVEYIDNLKTSDQRRIGRENAHHV